MALLKEPLSLPLANMALSYARLAHASTHGDEPSRRILTAMTSQPFLVGGSDRFDTRLMEAVGGNVVCKVGAEGVHTFAIIDRGIGFALKVEDGSQRAQFVARAPPIGLGVAHRFHLRECPAVGEYRQVAQQLLFGRAQ